MIVYKHVCQWLKPLSASFIVNKIVIHKVERNIDFEEIYDRRPEYIYIGITWLEPTSEVCHVCNKRGVLSRSVSNNFLS